MRRVVLHGRHEDANGHGDAGEVAGVEAALVPDEAQLIVTHKAVGIELEPAVDLLLRAPVVRTSGDENFTCVKHGRAHEATTLRMENYYEMNILDI